MVFCSGCGTQLQPNVRFCSGCGSPVGAPGTQPIPPQTPAAAPPAEPKETAYFKGAGELVVKRTEHKGTVTKAGALLFAAPTLGLSYLAFGRDKHRKSKAEGTLVVSNKAIYCAGNDYPFDKILSITRDGKKTILLTFEKELRDSKGNLIGSTESIEIELKMKAKDDCDTLFRALEQAKMLNVQF